MKLKKSLACLDNFLKIYKIIIELFIYILYIFKLNEKF